MAITSGLPTVVIDQRSEALAGTARAAAAHLRRSGRDDPDTGDVVTGPPTWAAAIDRSAGLLGSAHDAFPK